MDDHPMVRRGVATLLRERGWDVAGEAGSLAEFETLAKLEGPWDIVVLDVQLPDGDSVTTLRALRDAGFVAKVLVHSMLPDESVATQMLKAGANGYINKGSEPDELVRAVEKIASGGRYVSAAYAEALAEQAVDGKQSAPHESLSPKEFEVLCAYAQGKTPAQIAQLVGCQLGTVSSYRARIMRKLSVSTTAEIMQYAVRHRLVRL